MLSFTRDEERDVYEVLCLMRKPAELAPVFLRNVILA